MNKIVVLGNYTPSGHNSCNIYHPGGVAPTVMDNHGCVIAIMEIVKYEGNQDISVSERGQ